MSPEFFQLYGDWLGRRSEQTQCCRDFAELSTEGGFQGKIYAIGIATYCNSPTSARKYEEVLR